MKYLVTGGCGFIGSHLVAALIARGDDVIVLDNLSSGSKENCPPQARLVVGDILDHDQLTKDITGCFHLVSIASVSRCNADLYSATRTNVLGTIAILQSSQKASSRFPIIQVSSAAVYGNGNIYPLTEESMPLPLSSYGMDKLACEHYGKIAWQTHGIPNASLRLFNVYGPGQSTKNSYCGVIQRFIEACEKDQPITIFGDGFQTRDFIYIDDAVQAMIAAMDTQAIHTGEVFNVCTGVETTINVLAGNIRDLMRSKNRIVYDVPKADDIYRSVGSPLKFRARIDTGSPTPIETGLARTIQHWVEGA